MTVDKRYSFGGIVIRVVTPVPPKDNPIFHSFEATDGAVPDLTYVFHDRQPNGRSSIELRKNGDVTDVLMDCGYIPQNSLGTLLTDVRAAHHVLSKDAFVLHSSHVQTPRGAILFCAPSGTGKSTQASFWRAARGAVTVNEDRALIRRVDGDYLACGCWTKGSGESCLNVTESIRALVLLSQASENRVRQLSPNEVLRRVLPECSFNEKDAESSRRIIDLVSGMIGRVKIAELACVNNISSVDELERYI